MWDLKQNPFVESSFIPCPYLGGSTIGDSTAATDTGIKIPRLLGGGHRGIFP